MGISRATKLPGRKSKDRKPFKAYKVVERSWDMLTLGVVNNVFARNNLGDTDATPESLI